MLENAAPGVPIGAAAADILFIIAFFNFFLFLVVTILLLLLAAIAFEDLACCFVVRLLVNGLILF